MQCIGVLIVFFEFFQILLLNEIVKSERDKDVHQLVKVRVN